MALVEDLAGPDCWMESLLGRRDSRLHLLTLRLLVLGPLGRDRGVQHEPPEPLAGEPLLLGLLALLLLLLPLHLVLRLPHHLVRMQPVVQPE